MELDEHNSNTQLGFEWSQYFLNTYSSLENPYVEIIGKGLVSNMPLIGCKTISECVVRLCPQLVAGVLPKNYTHDELYHIYKDELESQVERYVSYTQHCGK